MARLFIAVDLAISVVERLTAVQRVWASRLDSEDVTVRWASPENLHVTLKFLGDTDEAMLPMLDDALGRLVKPLFPFEVSCQRVGAFPDMTRPRILWAGLDEKGAEVMGLLRQALERDIESLGFAPDARPYHPHVTLGRVKSKGAVDMTDLAGELGAYDFGSSYIKDIILYDSKLGPDGPQYTVRSRYPLGEN